MKLMHINTNISKNILRHTYKTSENIKHKGQSFIVSFVMKSYSDALYIKEENNYHTYLFALKTSSEGIYAVAIVNGILRKK